MIKMNGRMDTNLPPPPTRGTMRPQPGMEQSPGVGGLMSQIAGRGGGNPDEQAANLVMGGVQQLVQAAMLNPALDAPIRQAVSLIQEAVQNMVASMPQPGKGKGKTRKPKGEPTPGPGGPGPGGMGMGGPEPGMGGAY